MAGIDPITLAAIGAATGAIGSAATDQDPLMGAIMGGVTGGIGGATAAPAAAGVTAATGAGLGEAAALMGAGLSDAGAAALMGGSLSDAALAAQALGFNTAADAIGAGLMDAAGVTTQEGLQRLAQMGAPLASQGASAASKYVPKVAEMMGGIGKQGGQGMVAPPRMKSGQQPQMLEPMQGLLMPPNVRKRSRISLL